MSIEINETIADEATIIMRRIFDAPRDVVWATLTDPKHVANWYGGKGFENPVCEMDVRPGGRWHHVMRTPDGAEHEMEFVFLEVVKPEKLVWKSVVDESGFNSGPHNNTMSVTLEAVGQKTKWTLVIRFASFADRERAREIGFTRVLAEGTDKVNEIVKTLAGA